MFNINQSNANITNQNIGNNNVNTQNISNETERLNSLRSCLTEVDTYISGIDIDSVDKKEALKLIDKIKEDLTKHESPVVNRDHLDKLQKILQTIASSTIIAANAPNAIHTLINLINNFLN